MFAFLKKHHKLVKTVGIAILSLGASKLMSQLLKPKQFSKPPAPNNLVSIENTRAHIYFSLKIEEFKKLKNVAKVKIEIFFKGKPDKQILLDLDRQQNKIPNIKEKEGQKYKYCLINNNNEELTEFSPEENIEKCNFIPGFEDLELEPKKLEMKVLKMREDIMATKENINLMVIGTNDRDKANFINTLLTALDSKIQTKNSGMKGQSSIRMKITPFSSEKIPQITIYDTPELIESYNSQYLIDCMKRKLQPNLTTNQLIGKEKCEKADPEDRGPQIDAVILVEKIEFNEKNEPREYLHKFIQEILRNDIQIIPVLIVDEDLVPNVNLTNKDVPNRPEISKLFCQNLQKNLTYFNKLEAFPLINLKGDRDRICPYRDLIALKILSVAINKKGGL